MALDPDEVALEQLRRELDDVDAALAQIDEGTYGLCQACGQPIGDARLAAHPATRACDEHSPACDEHSPACDEHSPACDEHSPPATSS